MIIEIDLWEIATLFCSLFIAWIGVMFSAGKLLLAQFEGRLDDRFKVQEKSRIESQKHWDNKFNTLEQAAVNDAKEWQRIERELMTLRADIPINYVRREDYIRNQSVIEAKLDGLAVRIENALLKGDKYG